MIGLPPICNLNTWFYTDSSMKQQPFFRFQRLCQTCYDLLAMTTLLWPLYNLVFVSGCYYDQLFMLMFVNINPCICLSNPYSVTIKTLTLPKYKADLLISAFREGQPIYMNRKACFHQLLALLVGSVVFPLWA